jgi:hypothetical protein
MRTNSIGIGPRGRPVHTCTADVLHRSPLTGPVTLRRHSGTVVYVRVADAAPLATVPDNDPPDVPSFAKLPENSEPVCTIVILIGQPSMCKPPALVQPSALSHVPERSRVVGRVGLEQPAARMHTAAPINRFRTPYAIANAVPSTKAVIPLRFAAALRRGPFVRLICGTTKRFRAKNDARCYKTHVLAPTSSP